VRYSKADTQVACHKIPTVEFAANEQLSSYSGLVIFQTLFKSMKLKARLRLCFRHVPQQAAFDLGSLALLLITHVLIGFRGLRGMDYYRDDPMVLRLLGLRRFPDVSTVSRALRRVDRRGLCSLKGTMRNMVLEGIQLSEIDRLTLDFDGSVQSTTGYVEGTAIGYNKTKKGARSYYPLFCTVAQTGQFLDMHHRPGNVHDSKGAPAFMGECFIAARKALGKIDLEARIDSAFCNEETFDVMRAGDVEFTCSAPFHRIAEAKTLIEQRKRWTPINKDLSYFECEYKAKSWVQSYRFIFVRTLRKIRLKGPIQLDLFVPISHEYEYSVIVTNKGESGPSVIAFHHGRGYQERMFGEAKQDSGLGLIPTKSRLGNQTFTVCCMLAHNLTRELQMRTEPLPQKPQRSGSPLWRFLELGTIRQRILHRAGILRRPQGRLTLRVQANEALKIEMVAYLEGLNNFDHRLAA
jgi:hypothetical protein